MFHADNEIMLPIKLLEKHKVFSDIRLWLHFWSLKASVTVDTMPRTASHIPTFLCSLSYLKYLKQTSYFPNCFLCKPSPGFFLPQISFSSSSQGSQSSTSCICLHMDTSSIRLEGLYLHCLLVCNCSSHRKAHLPVVQSQDGTYTGSHQFSPHET